MNNAPYGMICLPRPLYVTREQSTEAIEMQGYHSDITIYTIHQYTSDTLCFHCCHTFQCQPVYAPFKRYMSNKKWTYYVNEIYCSFSCLVAASKSPLLPSYIKHLGIEGVKPAPPKDALQIFGGILDIDTFRQLTTDNIRIVNTPEVVLKPPSMVITKNDSRHLQYKVGKRYRDNRQVKMASLF